MHINRIYIVETHLGAGCEGEAEAEASDCRIRSLTVTLSYRGEEAGRYVTLRRYHWHSTRYTQTQH